MQAEHPFNKCNWKIRNNGYNMTTEEVSLKKYHARDKKLIRKLL